MKKLLFSISAFIFSAMIAQAQLSCPWAKKVGGTDYEAATAVATDASGNVYSLGYFYSSSLIIGTTTLHNVNNAGRCTYLAKHDSCGNFQWAKSAYGLYDDVVGTSLATDAAGNVYVAGYFNDQLATFGTYTITTTHNTAFIAQYNTAGAIQWVKASSGNDQEKAYGIAVDASNNIYMTGYFSSSSITFDANSLANGTADDYTNDMFVAKFDNTGTNLWIKGNTSNSSTDGDVLSYGIGVDASGNVYAGGYFESSDIKFGSQTNTNNGYNDIFVVKYNTSGTFQWLKTAGDSGDDGAYGLAVDAAGNVYITGQIDGGATVSFGSHSITNPANNPTAYIVKYDANGNDQWVNVVIEQDYSYALGNGITVDAAGNPYIIGQYSADSLNIGPVTIYETSLSHITPDYNFIFDAFVVKYMANGSVSWARSVGGDSSTVGISIAAGLNNSLYVTGDYYSPTTSFSGISLPLTPGSTSQTSDAFIANNISTWNTTPSLCLVSADSILGNNQYNVVYWDKTPYTTVASFIIYREVSTNIYKPIGTIPYSELSEFVDTARSVGPANGDPTVGTYRYAMQLMDTSGTFSLMSQFHNTVFFQNNLGSFTWNLYAVGDIGGSTTTTPVTNFHLMRDDANTGVYNAIGTVTGSQTNLSDPSYTAFATIANWRVDADGFNCNPTLRLANNGNSTDVARVKSHSNSTNNRQVGIKQFTNNNNQISVYPNPANSSFVIETNLTEKQQLQIIDVTGKIVLQQTISGKTSIDATILNDGVYTINVIGSQSIAYKKLVVVK